MTDDPNEALASIREARGAVARDLDYPPGYGLLYSLVLALLVIGPGLPHPWTAITAPIALGGLALLVHWWRKRFGFWISGFAPKRARWVSVGMGVALVALLAMSFYGQKVGPWWLFLVSGALAFILGLAGGQLWMTVWRRELEEAGR